MIIAPEIAAELRNGVVYSVAGERIGLRVPKRVWFNNASGLYVTDCGACYMWSDGTSGPWHIVPRSSPIERRPKPSAELGMMTAEEA